MRVGVLVSRRSVSSCGESLPSSVHFLHRGCAGGVYGAAFGADILARCSFASLWGRFASFRRCGAGKKTKNHKKPPTLSQLFAKDPEGEIVPLLASEAPEVEIHRELMQLFLGSEGTNLKCRVWS